MGVADYSSEIRDNDSACPATVLSMLLELSNEPDGAFQR
jgi:hypothetical protein